MYERVTMGVKVIVQPKYLDGQSKPEEGHYVWAYSITIENHGRETVTLRTRYWKITDALGHVQEVRGAGVVGEQPTLKPGDTSRTTGSATRRNSLTPLFMRQGKVQPLSVTTGL